MKTLAYHRDGQLAQTSYTNAQIPTPGVSYAYDPIYGRLSQITDGTGVTNFTYHPLDGVTLGAGNLASIDGPLADDTISHTYDALGRLKTRSIHGAANTTTIDSYDALGRVTQLTNPLGTFAHSYDPGNLQLTGVSAPNGLSTTFSYENAAGDFRLAGISAAVNGNPLSSHAYTYSPAGNITTWSQAIDANPAKTWHIGYDRADQLEAATLKNPASAVLEQHAWRYDKSGNRTSRQNGPQITKGTFNAVNQIVAEEAGGWMRVRGKTDEPATVRVKSNAGNFAAAETDAGNEFSGWVETIAGANTITIEATDTSPNANTKTQSYTVNVTGDSRTPTYDANGNMTATGSGQTYAWDAEDRLAKITYADASSTEFSYDGFSRRTRITEKDAAGNPISDLRYVWAGGNQPAEERDASGNSVVKRYFPEGERQGLASYYYTKDHLGSIRELTDASGNLTARYAYDMWGKRTKIFGTIDSAVGYTGHHHHERSGLILTWFRAYDVESGVWISRDPIAENGGLNLYGYVRGNPVGSVDFMGLDLTHCNRTGKGGGVPHSAFFVNNPNGKGFDFYSFGPGDKSTPLGNGKVEHHHFETLVALEEYLKKQGYDRFQTWDADASQDQLAKSYAENFKSPYNVMGKNSNEENNCAGFVDGALGASGHEHQPNRGHPNLFFNDNKPYAEDKKFPRIMPPKP